MIIIIAVIVVVLLLGGYLTVILARDYVDSVSGGGTAEVSRSTAAATRRQGSDILSRSPIGRSQLLAAR
ncbi:hypothetical protein [Dactylosporangium sp. NPDC051484]|uniref:hypothetical protein n=1 Tax=Dactylosporangium sp. NPDC051484 TaxID=3154942 RepID=UPI00344CE9FC